VLYEMLAGRTPFNSPSQFELMLAHVNQQPEPPSQFNATVPGQFDAVVLKALAKSPSERYQSAGEFDQALVAAITPAGIARAVEIAPATEPAAITVAELSPDLQTESVAAPLVAEQVAEEVAEEAVEVALEPVAAVAVELPPVVEPDPDPIVMPAMAEVPPEPVVATTELPAVLEAAPVTEPVIAEAAPEPVAAAAEIAPAVEPEFVAEPVTAEATPEPVAAAAIEPEPAAVLAAAETAAAGASSPSAEWQSEAQPEAQLAPAAAVMPAPVLLPETAVHASLWTAAEVVSRAARAPGAPSFDLPPVFATSPVTGETAHPTPVVPAAAAVVAALSETTAPDAASVDQPAPAASVETLSPYSVPAFLVSARARSESTQWAVFGGTAAFLGVIWTAIWFITGK
jgi:hypothetical protein